MKTYKNTETWLNAKYIGNTTIRSTRQIMQLDADVKVSRKLNIAYKTVSKEEASDLYATGKTIYMSITNVIDGFVKPLRFSKALVRNVWHINMNFYRFVDFAVQSHFAWNLQEPPRSLSFFVELPVK